ncbi:MAG: aspartate carbamoyltransferase regulatory subunit [Bacteroides sp.]|nr:aspartate carbamoyltransferase regulatory subunit [Bacteroides sp.]MCM1448414.1 aspartate carbamoyltransferase regulatory subunit [Bacteroides sp.]MCM1515052.1 aspartate carbamoyltransferase regulatory subunit [Paraprevotella sp.]
MNKKEMMVAAIENGTVLDHIPSERLFDVVSMLHLDKMGNAITIGFNLKSAAMGRKSIIKIADKYFTDEELDQLSVIAPDITLCVIKDYEIIEKRPLAMPDELIGIVRCPNPKCITNNEPMRTRFRSVSTDKDIIRCCYCNRDVERTDVRIVE